MKDESSKKLHWPDLNKEGDSFFVVLLHMLTNELTSDQFIGLHRVNLSLIQPDVVLIQLNYVQIESVGAHQTLL